MSFAELLLLHLKLKVYSENKKSQCDFLDAIVSSERQLIKRQQSLFDSHYKENKKEVFLIWSASVQWAYPSELTSFDNLDLTARLKKLNSIYISVLNCSDLIEFNFQALCQLHGCYQKIYIIADMCGIDKITLTHKMSWITRALFKALKQKIFII